MKKILIPLCAVALVVTSGCTTPTRRFAENETRAEVAGFSEYDINDTVSRAMQSVLGQDRFSPVRTARS